MARYGLVVDMVTVGVIFGGRSGEHSISCLSAQNVLQAIDRSKYRVYAIGIGTDGQWRLQGDPPFAHHLDLPTVDDSGEPISIRLATTGSRFFLADGTDLNIDVLFPVLHGPWGEDGSVQGLFETIALPYVGSGVLASAAAMDKRVMKSLLEHAGLPVVPWSRSRDHGLAYPVFVKPARAGSSQGIRRVDDPADLDTAITLAQQWDPQIIIEEAQVDCREIECGVLTDQSGITRASRCSEIRPTRGFYDFAAKYVSNDADLIVPADLTPEVEEQIRDLACAAFTALGCEGLARVDFFLDRAGDIRINEVNTMPGFTEISMFPQMWQATDMPASELVAHLLDDAMRRGTGLR